MLDNLSPARRRLVVSLVGLAIAGLVLATVVLLRTREPSVNQVSQTDVGPVVLVPGYGGSTTALDVLATALKAQGRDATVLQLAGDGTGDLRVQAQLLDAAVASALERTGAPSVDIVGYSAGGVVARLCVADMGGASLARRVLTIGSPHHGTDVARLAAGLGATDCQLACQQLVPDSDLLRQLNAGDETPDGPLWVSMWTTSDEIVIPVVSAHLDGAVNFSIQSVCGAAPIEHGDLPRNPSVIALTIEELNQAVPSIPRSGDC